MNRRYSDPNKKNAGREPGDLSSTAAEDRVQMQLRTGADVG